MTEKEKQEFCEQGELRRKEHDAIMLAKGYSEYSCWLYMNHMMRSPFVGATRLTVSGAVSPGSVISIGRSRFKHVVTWVDPTGWYVWCKPIGARDTREKRIGHYDILEIDKFMTEVYKSKQKHARRPNSQR